MKALDAYTSTTRVPRKRGGSWRRKPIHRHHAFVRKQHGTQDQDEDGATACKARALHAAECLGSGRLPAKLLEEQLVARGPRARCLHAVCAKRVPRPQLAHARDQSPAPAGTQADPAAAAAADAPEAQTPRKAARGHGERRQQVPKPGAARLEGDAEPVPRLLHHAGNAQRREHG